MKPKKTLVGRSFNIVGLQYKIINYGKNPFSNMVAFLFSAPDIIDQLKRAI